MELNRVTRTDNLVHVRTALLSVADKTGLVDFARNLIMVNPDIILYSTGGTYTALKEALGSSAANLRRISSYTGQPEMQGGLVKTLDFKIYLGLLSETYNDAHQADLRRLDATVIDLVVVNLYPFKKTVETEGITVEDARTNIDIGGPCMLRASAKNFLRVASVCDPASYPSIIKALKENNGALSIEDRFKLAKMSFAHTASYDSWISEYLSKKDNDDLSVYELM
ncbi:MAG: hypothetical protein JXB03_10460 [Spirochaetales bacterium]|nr:hypothetical protein [Spirochaetales bacterium]